jgi:PHD-finger
MEWQESTSKLLKDGSKLDRQDAKSLLDEGERLGFVCEEMKVLRNAIRLARNWANRVKRLDNDPGSPDCSAAQALIKEHGTLLIEMPEELESLQQAMKLYCVCRRPYSGFMIGCDECEEWYHGVCIGISESKADRVDKFVCVRCCVSRLYKSTAKDAVAVIKKWTCQKEFKRARAVESQKHLRKVRKETKEIEKQQAEIEALEKKFVEQGECNLNTSNGVFNGLLPPQTDFPMETATSSSKPDDPIDGNEKDCRPPQQKVSPEDGKRKVASRSP